MTRDDYVDLIASAATASVTLMRTKLEYQRDGRPLPDDWEATVAELRRLTGSIGVRLQAQRARQDFERHYRARR